MSMNWRTLWTTRQPNRTKQQATQTRRRPIGFEHCEARELLTAIAVTSSANGGVGTLRAALAQASSDPAITQINIAPSINVIQLSQSLTYTGGQALAIDGNVVNIQPTAAQKGAIDLFVATGGGSLSLSEITFRNGANGVVVTTPAAATGQIKVTLDNVTVSGNGLFGLHVDDLTNASAATVVLDVSNSTITGNGTAAHDQDGIRVDEGGAGSILARIVNSQLNGNGAEGVELDESGEGRVELNVSRSTFNDNGFIPSGDPLEPDYDDGIDVDEAGNGNVIVSIVDSIVLGNFDEGIDLNEGDFGDLVVTIANSRVGGNTDEGVALEEAGTGRISAVFTNLSANNNGAAGVALEEFDDGDIVADIINSSMVNNAGPGIFVEQTSPGTGLVRLRNVALRSNGGGAFEAINASIVRV